MIVKDKTQALLSKLPAKQSDLAKALNIDKRIVSKLVIDLEKKGIITRKKKICLSYNNKKINTYLIQKNVKVDVYDPNRISQLNPKYKEMFNNRKEFSPCTGCENLCTPSSCEKLISWIM